MRLDNDNIVNNQKRESFTFSAEEFDLGTVFRLILMQSKLLFTLILLGISVGVANYFFTERVYKATSLLQVYSNQNNINSEMNFDVFLGTSNTSDLDNIEDLYLSRSNILDIINKEKLNIEYANEDENLLKLLDEFVYKGADSGSSFSIIFKNQNFDVVQEEQIKLKNISYEQTYIDENFSLKINKPNGGIKEFKFKYRHPEKIFKTVKNDFDINASINRTSFYNRNSGLIDVAYNSNNIDKAVRVLNSSNNLFLEKNIKTESEQARKAISFIDTRLATVESELVIEKDMLKEFQETNKTVNVDLEIQSIIENIANIESKINEIDIEISRATNNYTATNPLYLDLLNQRETLVNQKTTVETRIRDLPLAQQRYIDLFKDVEISQQVYNQLLAKRLELSIQEASTLGNIRIVDDAYFDTKVTPRISSIINFFIISCILALLITIFRGLYFLPIANPAELHDNRISTDIFGVIPNVIEDEIDEDRFQQSIESLLVNINSTIKSKNSLSKAILFTSPTPSNGKSFVSREFSKTLAKMGHRVLLIDSDLKRGQQSKHIKINNPKLNETGFYKITQDNLEDLKVSENFYFIPRIRELRNTFSFLYSQQYLKQIELFKSHFEYIVIDTPPILSVSDTSILMSMSDIVVGLIRHEQSKISEIKQMLNTSSQLGIEFDGLIYNDYKKPSGYYGYYGFYGNYAYQYYAKKYLDYSYDYKNE